MGHAPRVAISVHIVFVNFWVIDDFTMLKVRITQIFLSSKRIHGQGTDMRWCRNLLRIAMTSIKPLQNAASWVH
jgi:hypothetical protein